MKKNLIYLMLALTCLIVLSTCEVEQNRTGTASTRAATTDQATTTRDTECGYNCEQIIGDCTTMCMQQYTDGNQIGMCVQNCINRDYMPCIQKYNSLEIQPAYVFAERGKTICLMDVDQHLFKITIELYTADRYVDTSCKHYADKWKIRQLAAIDCSYWTSLTDKNEMAYRVQRKIQELMAQGYYPTFTPEQCDTCPTYRFF